MGKQKKFLFYAVIALMVVVISFLGWKLLTATGVIGLPDVAHLHTRSALPHGLVLVLFLPIVATGALFYGIAYTKK